MDELIQALKYAMKSEIDSVTIYSEAALRAEGDVAHFLQVARRRKSVTTIGC